MMQTKRKENFERNLQRQQLKSSAKAGVDAFSFGEPESVLDTSWTNYLGVFTDSNDEYHTPPVDLNGLANLQHANAHHDSAIQIRANCVSRFYIDNGILSDEEMEKAAYEYKIFGQAYFRAYKNRFKQIVRLACEPGLPMRKMTKKNRYCKLLKNNKIHEYKPGEIIHLKRYDVKQQIYGIPDYLGGIQSVLLNQDATLFRRRYYLNGAHMGFIFFVGGEMDDRDVKLIQRRIKDSKGIGNFKNLFLNMPEGDKDSLQIIPVGDIATKDEFDRIKNITRNDIISMHRIQPALAGVMPEEKGGFGDIEKILRVDYENEVIPQQKPFLRLNKYLPNDKPIKFDLPVWLKDE